MANKRYVSYDDMNAMLNKMYRDMANDGYKPDVVVGLVRGGAIPAVHFSHYFDTPMVAFKYSLRDHPGADDISKLTDLLTRSDINILIVDDICDEGHTLHEVYQKLEEKMAEIRATEIAECEILTAEAKAAAAPGEDWNSYEVDLSRFDIKNFKTAVLQHNLGATLFEPDYCGEEINKVEKPEWIVYPFEY